VLAPENTLPSLERALEASVDLVEVDVIRLDGELVLAHSAAERQAGAPTLAEALAFLGARAPAEVGFMLDLKASGLEREVVAALAAAGARERTLVSSAIPEAIRRVRRLDSALATGLAYPRDRYGVSRRVPAPVIALALAVLRRTLPFRLARMLRRAGADVAVLNWAVVSPGLVRRCHELGIAVFAWTLEDDQVVARLTEAGVDGLVVNDPELLAAGRR